MDQADAMPASEIVIAGHAFVIFFSFFATSHAGETHEQWATEPGQACIPAEKLAYM